MKKALLIVAGILFFLTGAWAHGGHSALESDLGHYLTSPDHLFLAVVFVVITVALAFRKKLARVLVRDEKH
jgi:hypothetical protein